MAYKISFSVSLSNSSMPVKKNSRNLRIARYVLYKETLISPKEHLITFIGAYTGIGIIGFFSSVLFTMHDTIFLIGSFGASSVLIYGIPASPYSQPRNLIGGHVICALVGVTMHKLFPGINAVWIASALAVSVAIVLMQITKTLHPPGGATALIAAIGSGKIHALGYTYALSPVFSGVVILFIVAVIINNVGNRKYPSTVIFPSVKKRRIRIKFKQA